MAPSKCVATILTCISLHNLAKMKNLPHQSLLEPEILGSNDENDDSVIAPAREQHSNALQLRNAIARQLHAQHSS